MIYNSYFNSWISSILIVHCLLFSSENLDFFHFFFSFSLEIKDGFFVFLNLKLFISLFHLLIYGLSLSIKWYFSSDLSFYFIFLYFLMFLSSNCSGIFLFIGFCVSFKQQRCFDQIKKSHQIYIHEYASSYLNLNYFRHN